MRPLALLLALALASCRAPDRHYALLGVGSYHRHEVHPSPGYRGVWEPSGNYVEVRYRPSFPAFWPGEDPYSSRADSTEIGAFEFEVGILLK